MSSETTIPPQTAELLVISVISLVVTLDISLESSGSYGVLGSSGTSGKLGSSVSCVTKSYILVLKLLYLL
jgi:hypothetical protein